MILGQLKMGECHATCGGLLNLFFIYLTTRFNSMLPFTNTWSTIVLRYLSIYIFLNNLIDWVWGLTSQIILVCDKIDSGCMLLLWRKREPWERRWDLQNEWIGGIRDSGGCQLLLPLFVQMFPDHRCQHLQSLQWAPSPDCFLSTPMWCSSLRELWEQLTSSTIHYSHSSVFCSSLICPSDES